MEAPRGAPETLARRRFDGLACSDDEQVLDTERAIRCLDLASQLLCCTLYLAPVLHAQSAMAGQGTPSRGDMRLQHSQPPELAGEPGPIPTPPTPAFLQFVQSKAISAANPLTLV